MTFRCLLLQIRLSLVCLSLTFVRLIQGFEAFGDISSPLSSLAILEIIPMEPLRRER